MSLKIEIELSDEKLRDVIETLLGCAFEGGSNYWYRIDGYVWPEGKTRKDLEREKVAEAADAFEATFYPYIELPGKGGGIKVRDMEGDQGLVVLDWEKCKRGLKLMAECASMPEGTRHTHPCHWEHLLHDIANDCLGNQVDAETGDVFLQLALWGEVIYG